MCNINAHMNMFSVRGKKDEERGRREGGSERV